MLSFPSTFHLLLLLQGNQLCHSFAFNSISLFEGETILPSRQSTVLQAGLFGNLFGNTDLKPSDPNIPNRVFEIECEAIKLGGLKFALGLYLIGQQGTPVKGSWKVNPVSDVLIDMYYADDSAKFSLNLSEKQISVDRYGQPSLQYLLQESLMLHGLLDEIQGIAFGGEDIADKDRLLTLVDPENGIEHARGNLSARPE